MGSRAQVQAMTRTESQLRETVIAVQSEVWTLDHGKDFDDGLALLRILLEAVAKRNDHLPFTMTMDAASKRKPYDFARWFRKQE